MVGLVGDGEKRFDGVARANAKVELLRVMLGEGRVESRFRNHEVPGHRIPGEDQVATGCIAGESGSRNGLGGFLREGADGPLSRLGHRLFGGGFDRNPANFHRGIRLLMRFQPDLASGKFEDSTPFERVFRLEKLRIDAHSVLEIEASDIEDLVDLDHRISGAVETGDAVHSLDAGLQTIEVRSGNEVGFVEDDDIGKGDLLFGFVGVVEVLPDVLGIHERDHRVDMEFFTHFRIDEEGLNDWAGVGEAGGFNEDVVELVPHLSKAAEDTNQVPAHGAADAAVVHFENLLLGIDDELVVDADLTEFVFDHGNSFAVVRGENVVEERGFSGSKESREDGDWRAICSHNICWVNVRVGVLLAQQPTLETGRGTWPTSPRPWRVRGR